MEVPVRTCALTHGGEWREREQGAGSREQGAGSREREGQPSKGKKLLVRCDRTCDEGRSGKRE